MTLLVDAAVEGPLVCMAPKPQTAQELEGTRRLLEFEAQIIAQLPPSLDVSENGGWQGPTCSTGSSKNAGELALPEAATSCNGTSGMVICPPDETDQLSDMNRQSGETPSSASVVSFPDTMVEDSCVGLSFDMEAFNEKLNRAVQLRDQGLEAAAPPPQTPGSCVGTVGSELSQAKFDVDGDVASHAPSCDGLSTPICSPMARKTSDVSYANPDQTLLLFDWDDTLCPSSFCMEHYGLVGAAPLPDEEFVPQLHDLSLEAKALLERASELSAQVVIVTNAGEGWVGSSCAAWMPELSGALGTVEVVSARARWEPSGISSPTGWKAREFHNVIDRFYSRYENQSWKNIVAVGDAPYEHEALQRVVDAAPPHSANCRSKSVRFVTKPSIEALALQIRKLRETLETVVNYDGNLDIQIKGELLPTA
mmetsp:Transcript_30540/g.76810  ORF Transcript_30540/g.76810 Transcript_30540/m.76810 type:complete len:423 (+) Transcript_30540:52-1320(+)